MIKISISFILILLSFGGLYNQQSKEVIAGPSHIRYTDNAAKIFEYGMIKGMTMPMHSKVINFDYGPILNDIKNLGTDWVQINVKFYQENYKSSLIKIPFENDPFWVNLDATIKKAKALDLKISLLPIVRLDRTTATEWRGTIQPDSKSIWYTSYAQIIEKVADLASKYEVDILSIGSEFTSMQGDLSEWKEIITSTKSIYCGAISYSVNWDAVQKISFIDELDVLGVSCYYPLTSYNDPSFRNLKKAWSRLKSKILSYQNNLKLPIYLSELGYTSQDGTNTNPWNYRISNKSDLEEQKMCYEAFVSTVNKDSDFHGAFIYDWFDEGGIADLDYTVRGKPAEKVIINWFSK